MLALLKRAAESILKYHHDYGWRSGALLGGLFSGAAGACIPPKTFDAETDLPIHTHVNSYVVQVFKWSAMGTFVGGTAHFTMPLAGAFYFGKFVLSSPSSPSTSSPSSPSPPTVGTCPNPRPPLA